MKRNTIGVISFFAEYGAVILICLFLNYSSDFTFRFILLYVIIQIVFGHYQAKTLLIWEEIKLLVISHLCFYFASLLLIPTMLLNAEIILTNAIISGFMLVFCIVFARFIRIVLRDILAERVLIIGIGKEAETLSQVCKTNRFSLMDIRGYVDVNDNILYPDLSQKAVIEEEGPIYPIHSLANLVDSLRIDQVIIAVPQISKQYLDDIMDTLRGKVKKVKYVPQANGLVTFDSTIEDFDGLLVVSSAKGRGAGLKKTMKRLLDIVVGGCGCLLLLPLTLYVKHVNKKSGDHDPVFFIQRRIGLDGQLFSMYKYRTMVPNAECILEALMEKDPAIKEEYLTNKKLVNDPRITKAGNFLRKKSLDEFPQLLNVLKGDMSLVGPRPYLPREKEDMGALYDSVVRSKPGITGMWQCHGRNDVSFEDRCKMDDYYYSNWSIWLDVTILIKTVKTVFHGKGAR